MKKIIGKFTLNELIETCIGKPCLGCIFFINESDKRNCPFKYGGLSIHLRNAVERTVELRSDPSKDEDNDEYKKIVWNKGLILIIIALIVFWALIGIYIYV